MSRAPGDHTATSTWRRRPAGNFLKKWHKLTSLRANQKNKQKHSFPYITQIYTYPNHYKFDQSEISGSNESVPGIPVVRDAAESNVRKARPKRNADISSSSAEAVEKVRTFRHGLLN